MQKIIVSLFLLLALWACKTEEFAPTDPIIPEPEIIKDEAPATFPVYVLRVTHNAATITWDAAQDVNKDVWYYTFSFNDSIYFDKIKSDTLIRLQDLKSLKTYHGKVMATDKKLNKREVPFEFTTAGYAIKFDTIYSVEKTRCSGYTIEKTKDGGYVVGGEINYGDGPNTLILKFDSLGYIQWHKVFLHLSGYSVNIRQTSDEGYVVADGMKLLRLDSYGKELWRYSLPNYGETSSLAITPDNNYLITSNVNDTISGKQASEIIKLTDNKEILWRKRFVKSDITHANFIETANDGNYLILGTDRKFPANQSPDTENNTVILTKIDESGNILWQNSFNNPGFNFVSQLTPTADKGCIIAGFSMGYRDITEAMIIKVDESGNQQWLKTFLWDSFQTKAYSVKQTNDGYLFCGINGYSPAEAILVKLTNNGDIQWKKQYYPTYGDYIWNLNDIELTSDNGIILLGGKSWVWSGAGKEAGLWVKKTNGIGD